MNELFEIGKEYKVKSILSLRRQFFKYHSYKHGDRTFASMPNALVMNPPHLIEDEFSQDVWFAVYCRGFYVQITKNINKMRGPHAAMLFIQIYPGKTGMYPGRFIHLGSAQFRFMFFDKKRLLKRLSKAIRLREYFATEAMEETLIEFDEPNPKILEAF